LKNAPSISGEKLIQLHADFGSFIGKEVNRFLKNHPVKPMLIASHGHTIFHQPENNFTFQAGCGHAIAAETNVLTIADFRSGDVALGGQGAPLVPVGDRLLFADYENCLNLGGFANISFERHNQRIAFDVCPANLILNWFAAQKGLAFDDEGKLGRKGKIKTDLLEQLNALPFYRLLPPKSLGREWLENEFLPVVIQSHHSFDDKLRTVYEHIAIQIANSFGASGKILVTGGGALNSFFVERIKKHTTSTIEIPDKQIINYKEALLFAFLGVLRLRNEINCLASVTGAKRDSSAGVIFQP
ncbi:MAG TPA: anhydro-N-acetylmuramic acid kinase, partial [Prolixibacteraceae bacterium]|nr:anhydro-N-acetylmuramic acid kinase [Prolixibacteraceae bacterium]